MKTNITRTEMNRIALVEAGALDVIRSAMERHESDARLHNHCSGALLNLSIHGLRYLRRTPEQNLTSCSPDSNKSKLLESGVIPALLASMKRFPAIEIIQERCVRVLLHCSAKGELRLLCANVVLMIVAAENLQRLRDMKAMSHVRKAIQSHSSSTAILRFGQRMLNNVGSTAPADA
jgi:hypothetical protein